MNPAPRTHRRSEGIRLFRVQLSVLIVVYTLAVYTGIFFVTRALLLDSLRAQGASYLSLVVDMRSWNASNGAVWVSKSGETTTNPYLTDMGITADIRTESGATLTMRNPSAMTREISEITRSHSGVYFHLTSLSYLNPANAPDEWERAALESFQDGVPVVHGVDDIDGQRFYRYAAPLNVDDSCLSCHQQQGYEVGDIRGGITVSIPMAGTDSTLKRAGYFLGGMTIVTLLGALLTLQWLAARMEHRVAIVHSQLTEMAITDALTGVLNRGAALARLDQEYQRARRDGSALSLLMFDLDHFKQVNDTFGHAAGDQALREFAERASNSLRPYDVVGRLGGEEFLVIAPGADAATAFELAERIRNAVNATPIDRERGITITVSAGVATLSPTDSDAEELLLRSDNALYAAKRAGRDRVESAEEPADDGASRD